MMDGERRKEGRRKSQRAKLETLKLGPDESLGTTVTLHTAQSLLHQLNRSTHLLIQSIP